MNLLEHFVLQHLQVLQLKSELLRASSEPGMQEAKVEMNLTPRLMESDSGSDLPSYQVSAELGCESGLANESGPAFTAAVRLKAIYQQTSGTPVDFAEFTSHHATLARQLYPLLQQEMRGLLTRMGLSQIQLPYDLTPREHTVEAEAVELSGSLH